jgi:phosphate transport system substrate-binding protein
MNRAGIIIFIFLLFFSCKKTGDGRTETLTGGRIDIACSSEFENLIDAEISAFEGCYDSAHITPFYKTEDETVRLLIEDSVRFAVTSRKLNEWERSELKKRKLDPRESVIAFDAIALITAQTNPDSLITLADLKKILRGEITEWSQINPGNKAGKIRLLFDSRKSGVFHYLIDSILQKNIENVNPNLYELGTVSQVIEKTSELPNALGFIAVNHISDEHSGSYSEIINTVKLMKLSREDKATAENSFFPYQGDIITENYPLWRSVYIITTDPKSGLSSGFAIFIANQIGQKVIQKAGLLPITEANNFYIEITDGFSTQNKNK